MRRSKANQNWLISFLNDMDWYGVLYLNHIMFQSYNILSSIYDHPQIVSSEIHIIDG